jgi:hypothetical protein
MIVGRPGSHAHSPHRTCVATRQAASQCQTGQFHAKGLPRCETVFDSVLIYSVGSSEVNWVLVKRNPVPNVLGAAMSRLTPSLSESAGSGRCFCMLKTTDVQRGSSGSPAGSFAFGTARARRSRASIEAGEGRMDRRIRLRNVFQYDPRSLAESGQHHTLVMALMQSGA